MPVQPANELAVLEINGQQYKDWTSFHLIREYGVPISEAHFVSSEGSPQAPNWAAMQIKPGDTCDIILAGKTAFRGYVNIRQATYDGNSHQVQISARSSPQDAVDSSVVDSTGQYRGYTWPQIAKQVLKKFNTQIDIKAKGQGVNKKYDDVQVIPGETNFQFLHRLGIQHGLIITDNENGHWTVTDSVMSQSTGNQLQEGNNIISARCIINDMMLSSPTWSRSQKPPIESKGDWGRPSNQINAQGQQSPDISRWRPRIIITERPAVDVQGAQMRVDTEQNWTNTETIDASITVYGWLDGSGELWKVGTGVFVASPMLMLNQEMAIKQVVYSQDQQGTITTIHVCRWMFLGGFTNLATSGQAGAPAPQ